MDKINWEKLIKNALNKDQSAIVQLYNATFPQGFTVAMQITKNEQDAYDALQDAYVTVIKKLDTLQEPEKFKSWFNCIVANKCRDFLKKRKDIVFSDIEIGEDIEFEDTLESNAIEFCPEESVDYSETKRLLNEILQNLPEEQKLCILMFYYDELSVKEISETLNCSENTVKSRLNYGRKKIKEDVQALAKKGTKLYSIAPIPFIVWMLRNMESEKATTVAAAKVWSAMQAGSVVTSVAGGTASTTSGLVAGLGTTKVGLAIVGVVAATAITGGSIVAVSSNNETSTAHKSFIVQTVETVTIEAGDEFLLEATDFLSFDEEIYDEILIDASDVNPCMVGEYEVIATYDNQEYVLSIVVEDTTSPLVRLHESIFYHKDNNSRWNDLELIIEEIFDYSEFSETVLGCEKIAGLESATVDYITQLRSNIPTEPSVESLAEEPTDAGIYRMVIEVKDIYDNATLREVYMVFGEVEEINIEEILEESAELVPHEDIVIPDNINTETTGENANADSGATEDTVTDEDVSTNVQNTTTNSTTENVEESEDVASKEEIVLEDGEYLDELFIYSVSNGQVTISGNSDISGDITIPASYMGCPVVAISNSAFFNHTEITSITIPSTVTTIGSSAFFDCDGITSITIPNSVTSLGKSALGNCTNLNTVIIGSGVQVIKESTFSGCTNLTTITGCKNVVEIEKMVFAGCASLTDIYYDGVEEQWNLISIGINNAALTRVTIHYNE